MKESTETKEKAKPSTSASSIESITYLEPAKGQSVEMFVNELIKSNQVVVFSKTTCPFCHKVKGLFKKLNITFTLVELDKIGNFDFLRY